MKRPKKMYKHWLIYNTVMLWVFILLVFYQNYVISEFTMELDTLARQENINWGNLVKFLKAQGLMY